MDGNGLQGFDKLFSDLSNLQKLNTDKAIDEAKKIIAKSTNTKIRRGVVKKLDAVNIVTETVAASSKAIVTKDGVQINTPISTEMGPNSVLISSFDENQDKVIESIVGTLNKDLGV